MRGTPTEPEKRTPQEQAHGTEAQEEEKAKQRSDEHGQPRVVDRRNRTQQSRNSNRTLGSERRQMKTPRCHQEEETRKKKREAERVERPRSNQARETTVDETSERERTTQSAHENEEETTNSQKSGEEFKQQKGPRGEAGLTEPGKEGGTRA